MNTAQVIGRVKEIQIKEGRENRYGQLMLEHESNYGVQIIPIDLGSNVLDRHEDLEVDEVVLVSGYLDMYVPKTYKEENRMGFMHFRALSIHRLNKE